MSNTPSRLLRLKQIIGDRKAGVPPIIPVSKSTWWAGCKTGRFPTPLRLGGCTVWREEDVLRLVDGNEV